MKEVSVLAKFDVYRGVYIDLVLQGGLWGSTLNTVMEKTCEVSET